MSTISASPWRRNSTQPESKTFSTEAEEFVPKSFAEAKEFVPKAFSAEAAEFVPKAFSTAAPEFVPKWKTAAPEFVPKWKKAEEAQVPVYSQVSCCIDLDAYSDASSDSDECPASPTMAPAETVPAVMSPWRKTSKEFVPKSMLVVTESGELPLLPESRMEGSEPNDGTLSFSKRASSSTLSTSEGSKSDLGSGTDSSSTASSREQSPAPLAASTSYPPLTMGLLSLLQWRHMSPECPDEQLPTAAEPEPGTPEAAAAAAAQAAATKRGSIDSVRDSKQRQDSTPLWRRTEEPKDSTASWRRTEEPGTQSSPIASKTLKTLEVSEDSWTARQRARRSSTGTSKNDEELVRSMKSILNKITVEKFDMLSMQLANCGIRSALHMEILIQEVFEKATTQHHFIDMYADLCVLLNKHVVIDDPDPKMTFKKILLNCCQASFEKRSVAPSGLTALSSEDRTAAERIFKTKMLGNIRFVGSLFVRKMMASKVMLGIMEELLQDPSAEALETLAAFLTVVGPTFDTPDWSYRVTLNAVFSQVDKLAKKPSIQSRSRCLLKDVLDLRKQGWNDMKPKKIEGPLKLEQVAAQAAMENGGVQKSAMGPSGWETVGGGNRSAAGDYWKHAGGSPQGRQVSSPIQRPFAGTYENQGSDIYQMKSGKTTKDTSSGQAMLAFLRAREVPEPAKKPSSFDKESCRREVSAALTEFRLSHDVKETLLRIGNIGIPVSHQAFELNEMLTFLAEEGSQGTRKAGFDLVARLFSERHWKSESATEGIRKFVEDTCADLKCDVPALPQIVREELHPALAPLVQAQLLGEETHATLMSI